jgi:hypothetical protein
VAHDFFHNISSFLDQQDQCDQRTSFFPLLKAGLPRREDGEFYPLMKMIFADKMASLSL